jgi:lysophospholipase L1-like esterase
MKKMFPYLFPILLLVALEIIMAGLNLVVSWDETIYQLGLKHSEFLGNPESQNLFWFLRDPHTFWKLKPGRSKEGLVINKLGFRGEGIDIKKDTNTLRIVCLGNSCTLGLEVAEPLTYVKQLESKLKEAFPNKNVQVINAGVSGFSTYQILQNWTHYIHTLSPDIVTVYAAQNDHIFAPYKEDKDITMPAFSCKVSNFLFSFRVCRALNSMISWVIRSTSRSEFTTPYDESRGILRRVMPDDYASNLKMLSTEIRKITPNVIFITTPFIGYYPFTPYPYPEIINKNNQKEVRWNRLDQISKNYLDRLITKSGSKGVLQYAMAKIELHPDWPTNYFIAAYVFDQMKDSTRAQQYYFKADSLDQTRHAMNRYNSIMCSVAAEKHLPLVDLAKNLWGPQNQNLFVFDGHHPNESGHTRIAEELFKVIYDLLAADTTLAGPPKTVRSVIN